MNTDHRFDFLSIFRQMIDLLGEAIVHFHGIDYEKLAVGQLNERHVCLDVQQMSENRELASNIPKVHTEGEGEGEFISVVQYLCYERRSFRMGLNPFNIRWVLILVVTIDPTRRMEYQKNFLERRHTEVYTWFRNFRINKLDDYKIFYFIIVVILHFDWC